MSRGITSLFTALAAVIILTNTTLWAATSNFRPGIAVVRLSQAYKVDLPEDGAPLFGIAHIDQLLLSVGVTKVETRFRGMKAPETGKTDLTRYYTVYFKEEWPVSEVCRDLGQLDGVELAEPWFIERSFLDHNDPQRGNQYAMDLIRANQAHDLSTGDRTVPIAIVDSGVDLQHRDLSGNLWVNPGEDLDDDGVITEQDRNNRDDDGNGYRDDFYGWDFVGENGNGTDNDPDDEEGHGTHCAGDASAVTNNRIGISSVGYSCGIMAVRAGYGGFIQRGYDGITYAVNNGAKVISCSWGGDQDYEVGHEVIRYAAEHDVIVVAASGNEYGYTRIYPGAYDELVCVAATDDQDRKADFSNYGEWVDICAPGVDILSTFPGNQYGYASGTSMATPITAGVIILLRARYPLMSREEILTILYDGADDISDRNQQYNGRLGAGRVNAFRSLELGNRPILSIGNLRVSSDENNNERLDPGESASFTVEVFNSDHGVATDGMSVSITTDDQELTIVQGDAVLPDLEPGQSVSNIDTPFNLSASEAQARTTWVTVTVTADPGGSQITKTFELVIGRPDVMLIDDDDGSDIDSTYLKLITRAGHGWERWDVSTKYSPEGEQLIGYKMVIWATGNAVPPLDEIDRWQIQNALEGGANIVLIGNGIGDDPDNQALLYDFFGAQHEQDEVRAYTVEGIGGEHLMPENLQVMLQSPDARRSPSTMTIANGADSLLLYHEREIIGIAAVHRTDSVTHSKTAYLGFSMEYASDSRTPRQEVLSRLYDWFVAEDPGAAPTDPQVVPQVLALSPAYPNPFNGMVAFQFTVPTSQSYRLTLCDPAGREVALLRSGEQANGTQSIYWDATAMPAGAYFARLTTPGYGAVTQQLLLVK